MKKFFVLVAVLLVLGAGYFVGLPMLKQAELDAFEREYVERFEEFAETPELDALRQTPEGLKSSELFQQEIDLLKAKVAVIESKHKLYAAGRIAIEDKWAAFGVPRSRWYVVNVDGVDLMDGGE